MIKKLKFNSMIKLFLSSLAFLVIILCSCTEGKKELVKAEAPIEEEVAIQTEEIKVAEKISSAETKIDTLHSEGTLLKVYNPGIEDTEVYVEFTDKVMIMGSSRPSPYVISSVSMNAELEERYSQLDITGVVYISALDNGESFLNYMILKLDEDNLS